MAQEENIKQEEEQQQAAPEQQEQTENTESRKKCKAAKKECQKKEAELQKQIDELTKKVEDEKADYVRLMAEFETFRRRNAEEKLALVNSAAADTIKGMLPVLDDCERAMQMLASSSDEAAKEGTSLIYNKLMDYLKTRGLEVIDAKGKEFDYRSTARAYVDQARAELKRDGLEESVSEELDALSKSLDMDKETFLRLKKDEVIPFIEEEIAVRYYFQRAGAEIEIRYDDQLKEALTKPLISID